MQSLARRGLIWIERRKVTCWQPDSGWDDRDEIGCYFGLTVDGLSVAKRE